LILRALALYHYVNKEAKHKNLKLSVSDENDRLLKQIVLDLQLRPLKTPACPG